MTQTITAPDGTVQTVVTEGGQQIDMSAETTMTSEQFAAYNQGNVVYVNEAGEVVGQGQVGADDGGQFVVQQMMDPGAQVIEGTEGTVVDPSQIVNQEGMEVSGVEGMQYADNVVYQTGETEPTTITTDVIYQNPDGTQFIIDANGQQHQVIVDTSGQQEEPMEPQIVQEGTEVIQQEMQVEQT